MRISIVGLPGSGKSTLARMVSNKLSIPHIQIDRFWFESGGRQSSRNTPNIEQVRALVREKAMSAISAESWVSDGFYSRLQPDVAERANVLVFLDVSLWRRLLNHAERIFEHPRRHQELTMWDEIKFFPEIIRRTFVRGPTLRKFLDQYKDKLVVLRSRTEIGHYLDDLE